MYTTLGGKLSGELASLVLSVDVVRCVVGDIVSAIFSLFAHSTLQRVNVDAYRLLLHAAS